MKTDEGNKHMHVCSKCKCASCEKCHEHDHYLEEFAVQQCKSEESNHYCSTGFPCNAIVFNLFVAHFVLASILSLFYYVGCGVKACGVCRDHKQCGGHDCMYVYPLPWYCSDCDVLKPCASCGSLCCERDGCAISCASCNDVFCFDDGYNRCKFSVEFCYTCEKWFCTKEECPSVLKCEPSCWYSNYSCDECIAAGKAKSEFIKCERCEDHHCDRPKCREMHKDCKKISAKAKMGMKLFELALDSGRW